MYLLENIELFRKNSSNPDTGIEGLALLNNGFYYAVTIFDNYTDWKKIEVLEDQYTNEELEAIENELFLYKKNSPLTPPYHPNAGQASGSKSGSPGSAG